MNQVKKFLSVKKLGYKNNKQKSKMEDIKDLQKWNCIIGKLKIYLLKMMGRNFQNCFSELIETKITK